MVGEFMDFWTVMGDAWQSRTITRVSRKTMVLLEKDKGLIKKLDKAEGEGAIKKVVKAMEKAINEEKEELKNIGKIGIQTQILELHETQRLTLLNKELTRIGGKVGIDKVRRVIDAVNRNIKNLQNLEEKQMAKFDKLKRNEEGVYTRAIEMDEGSIVQEMKSIGVVERRLVKKIQKIEKQAQNIAQKIETEKKPEKLDPEFRKLEGYINDLGSYIDKEVKYFDEGVKDEIIFVIYLVQRMKKLEARVKKYVQEGFPESIAAKLNIKIEQVFEQETRDIGKLVDDYRYAISQAQRGYAKAA